MIPKWVILTWYWLILMLGIASIMTMFDIGALSDRSAIRAIGVLPFWALGLWHIVFRKS